MNKKNIPIGIILLLLSVFGLQSCYTFKDVSIPPEIKTVKINLIENKARYINPSLAPALTDRLRQKIVSQTRLTQTNNDNADYDISAVITDYSVTTAGISAQQASTNRLNVTVKIVLVDNTKDQKRTESTVTRNFDFSANLSLQAAESQLNEEILKNITDEIFNRLFSNW